MIVTPVAAAGIRSRRKASAVRAGRDGMVTEADFGGCRWIEGDPSPLRPGMFCGLPVPPGESWCTKHRGVVFGQDLAAKFGPPGSAEDPTMRWQDRRSVGSNPGPNRRED